MARRASGHAWVDLAAADLGIVSLDSPQGSSPIHGHRFGVFKSERLLSFLRLDDGSFIVEEPARWDELLGTQLAAMSPASQRLPLTERESFQLTYDGPYPDPFYRIATAFTDPTAAHPPQVILSLPDDVASFGFHLPGGGDRAAIDGFHGALTRGSSLSVLASQSASLPPALRADDLLNVFPELKAHLQR